MRRDVVLMVNTDGKIEAVNQTYEEEKRMLGWFFVARDADVYADTPEMPVQSHVQRHPYRADLDVNPEGDEGNNRSLDT